ncbi:hypothetical protein B0H16DRAFT_794664 [Mycena metata]|uniref:Nephrocystin 3-like N-terminal domain-containing protein n=1 Tax=Mycena metata TaxID=1033252 RepID=A0AAD7NAM7_9AGAR|nr:hypothetical protein B0H16DRAFT_794664 [Mycena metata]
MTLCGIQAPCTGIQRFMLQSRWMTILSPELQSSNEAYSPNGTSTQICELCPLTSMITLQLYHHTFFPRREDPVIGQCRIGIEDLSHQCGLGKVVSLEIKADGKVSGRLSVLLEKSEVAAGRATSRMESTLVTLPTAGPSLDGINAAVEVGGSQNNLATALGVCLDHIDVVVKMGDKLAQVHPYVSTAWSILSSVYQAVKQQREMDNKVVKLVKDIVELYSFKDDIHFVVAKIQILEDTLIKIAKHTLLCANFLAEYSQPKFSGQFCICRCISCTDMYSERTIRAAFVNDNQRRIGDLSNELVKLKESFTHALRIQSMLLTTEVHGTVARLDKSGELKKLRHISYDASLRTGCLPGTREDILADISNWLTTPSSSGNILWLSGVAGSGKSSVATTLSQHLREADHLGAFLFFTWNNLANSNPTV